MMPGRGQADGLFLRVAIQILVQVDAAVRAERRDRLRPSARRARTHSGRRRRKCARRASAPPSHAAHLLRAVLRIPSPHRFAGGAVQRDDLAPGRVAVDPPVDHDGLRLQTAATGRPSDAAAS